tara:strand:+ start:217 stop:1635 length:1419 start_codon:yes stop_codon:yes gene_type:complete
MPDDRPNILLITTDQQRGDCLGIEGHPVLQTPYLDWVAASGVRFNHAYSACPVCVPARRTMITGRSAPNHGLMMNGNAPLPFPTLPGELGKAGYETHLVGKGHFGLLPTEAGFETAVWADSPRAGVDNDYQRFLVDNGIDWPRASDAHGALSNGYPARPWHLEDRFHFSNWVADGAVRFLTEREDDRPFFLMANFLHPHQPLTPPSFYYDKYLAMDLPEPCVGDWARVYDEPVRGLEPEPWRVSFDPVVMKQIRAAYYGSIEHIDHQIARFLMQYVLPSNTVVIFLSDHGEMLGDHQWLRKRNPFEASARIPMLWKFPDRLGIPQRRVLEHSVELMDLMPTLLELVGVEVPDTVDGKSLLPILKDEGGDWRAYVHGECAAVPSTDSGMQYVTDGKRKFAWYPGRDEELFFDLEIDPNEMVNQVDATDRQEEVALWRSRMIESLTGRPEGFTDGERLLKREGPTPGRREDVLS